MTLRGAESFAHFKINNTAAVAIAQVKVAHGTLESFFGNILVTCLVVAPSRFQNRVEECRSWNVIFHLAQESFQCRALTWLGLNAGHFM
eukprot:6272014-Karenia_brevis.AAC.1